MAIASNTQSTSGPDTVTSGTPLNISHVVSGSNTYLLVGVVVSSTNTDVVTGVTYDGVAMTRLATQSIGTDTVRGYSYGLVAPHAGTNNIGVSVSGTQTVYTSNVQLTGAKQTGQPDATHTTNTSGSSPLNETLTTVADNSCHITLFFVNTSNPSPGTSTTAINANSLFAASPFSITPAGSNIVQATWSGSQQVGAVGVSIAPSVTAANTSSFFALM